MRANSAPFALPGTDHRVPLHTSAAANLRIRECTLANLRRFEGAPAAEIDKRIQELRREWDIERTLEANAASVALVGLALGLAVDRRFMVLPAMVGGFLLQHAVQGWCPPLPVFRRLGIRTSAEIHAEILALRIMRDDFNGHCSSAEEAMALARA